MKVTLTLLLFFSIFFPEIIQEDTSGHRGLASSWTIIPARSLAGLHYIFKGFTIDEEEEVVKVTGPVIQLTNVAKDEVKIFRDGYSGEIDLETFEDEQDHGQSVFEATTGTGTSVGTAFLVGRDIVFTNRHVMAIKPDATVKVWPCGKFSIKLNHKEEVVTCKEVKFCSVTHDYCVVELNKMSNEKSVGQEVRILRLTNKIKVGKEEPHFHIGNAAGLGLQASRGLGLELNRQTKGEFNHYVPTLGGSSGAPIFNDRGEVVGINWGHSGKNYIDEKAYNRGVFGTAIYNELLPKHSEVLKQIKSFRKWHRKSKTPIALKVKNVKS
jgi:hypothetical protein